MRWAIIAALFSLLSCPSVTHSQLVDFETRRSNAQANFHSGKIATAVKQLIDLLPNAPSIKVRAALLRDLMETCTIDSNWDCVRFAIRESHAVMTEDPSLKVALQPESALYEAWMAKSNHNNNYFLEFHKIMPNINFRLPLPSLVIGQLNTLFAVHHAEHNNIGRAETSIAIATMGLLLSSPADSYSIGKLVLLIINALIEVRDIAGAYALAETAEPYLVKTVPRTSYLYALYKQTIGSILSHTNHFAAAADNLAEAAELYESLEMNKDVKDYRTGICLNRATAAYLLAGNASKAKLLHDAHPTHLSKQMVQARRSFLDTGEFYYAIVDIFLAAMTNAPVDQSWSPHFQSEIGWQVTELQRAEIESLRLFALGLLQIGAGSSEQAVDGVLKATKLRLANFESTSQANSLGFILPDIIDKIIVATGLTAAMKRDDRDSQELVLQGADFLGRNLRHNLVDAAALLASQTTDTGRRNMHSYLHIVERTRRWELDHIARFLNNQLKDVDRGRIISEYEDALGTLETLKLASRSSSAANFRAILPALVEVQNALAPDEAFVAHFESAGGIGQLCVTNNHVQHGMSPFTMEIVESLTRLRSSLRPHPDSGFTTAFPIASAEKLFDALFSRIDACLKPGMHLYVATIPDLSDIPFGALIKPTKGVNLINGSIPDLSSVRWMIYDHSFSSVVSARHLLASKRNFRKSSASRPLLGIGNPTVSPNVTERSVVARDMKARGFNVEFDEIPETAAEIRAVAKIVSAKDTDILLGQNGTEQKFRTMPLDSYDVIHFATHGLMGMEVAGLAESALLLSPNRGEGDRYDDGFLTSGEISRLSLGARLIVLSACNTVRTNPSQVHRGIQDLQSAFTMAGSSTVLGTLWQVESLAAQEMIVNFFKEWRTDRRPTAAHALSVAIRKYLRTADGARRHPGYWAAFVIAGNGSVTSGLPKIADPQVTDYEPLAAYESGGEILHAVPIGNHILSSMIGEWDGARMNGIISRRSLDGQELWRLSSRVVGAGKIAITGQTAIVAGYQVSEDPIPVLRGITLDGALQWTSELSDLAGYSIADIVPIPKGVALLAIPNFGEPERKAPVVLLTYGSNGAPDRRVELGSPVARTAIAGAKMTIWENRLTIALNFGPSIVSLNSETVLGFATGCFGNARSEIWEIGIRGLETSNMRVLAGVRISGLRADKKKLLMVGETFRRCSSSGLATLFQFEERGFTLLWKDDTVFDSSARDIALEGTNIVLLLAHDRKIGVERRAFREDEFAYNNKRLFEDDERLRETSIVRLSRNGDPLDRASLSRGLSVYTQGMLHVGGQRIVYGGLGGVPAHTMIRASEAPVSRGGRHSHRGRSGLGQKPLRQGDSVPEQHWHGESSP